MFFRKHRDASEKTSACFWEKGLSFFFANLRFKCIMLMNTPLLKFKKTASKSMVYCRISIFVSNKRRLAAPQHNQALLMLSVCTIFVFENKAASGKYFVDFPDECIKKTK